VDLLADEARAAWLCSWQRSGSTLLAQVLASAPHTRLVYEPANLPGGLFTGEDAARVPLPTGPGPELSAVERALRGRVHGPWVDQLASGRVFRRRVVKDVRAVGLLGIVAARHPTTPLVLLVRHPLAVARSVVALGWTPDGATRDEALVAEVRRWAELHAAALEAPAAHRALVIAYEHLVLDPDGTLDRVLAHLADHHAAWRGLAVDRARLAVPSATAFRRSEREPDGWIEPFDDVAPTVLAATVRALSESGLDALYGATPEPLVGTGELRAALRDR
jgi:hypothetical protein